MIRTLRRLVDIVWGTTAPPPAVAPPPKQPPAPDAGPPRIEYRDQTTLPAAARPSMQYHKEHMSLPKVRTTPWRRVTRRQRVLVVLAGISLLAIVVAWTSRFTVSHVLPAATHGIWATESPAHGTRRLELRAHHVAFTTSDTVRAVDGLQIQSVKASPDPRGTRYDVVYLGEGGPDQLSFVFSGGPAPEIRLVNQPRMVWRRISVGQSLMRPLF